MRTRGRRTRRRRRLIGRLRLLLGFGGGGGVAAAAIGDTRRARVVGQALLAPGASALAPVVRVLVVGAPEGGVVARTRRVLAALPLGVRARRVTLCQRTVRVLLVGRAILRMN